MEDRADGSLYGRFRFRREMSGEGSLHSLSKYLQDNVFFLANEFHPVSDGDAFTHPEGADVNERRRLIRCSRRAFPSLRERS